MERDFTTLAAGGERDDIKGAADAPLFVILGESQGSLTEEMCVACKRFPPARE